MDASPQRHFSELRTARYALRRIVASDAKAVFLGLSDPRVIAHYGVSFSTLEETQVQMRWFEEIFANGTGVWWAICEPSLPGDLIGAVGLNDICHQHMRAELGYWLLPPFWGRGIAKESVASLLAHAFGSMKLHRVGAEVEVDNPRSIMLLEKLGFTFEGTRRSYEYKNGKHLDLSIYSRLAVDPMQIEPGAAGP